jgi:hypothetical protein
MPELAMLRGLGAAGVGVWAIVLMALVTMIRTWPLIQMRTTEARKQRSDADADLRGDLLERIAKLETELLNEQHHREQALIAEQARCEERLREVKREMDTRYDGLMRQFIAAQMAWAQAIPPNRRSPEIDRMLESLNQLIPPPCLDA